MLICTNRTFWEGIPTFTFANFKVKLFFFFGLMVSFGPPQLKQEVILYLYSVSIGDRLGCFCFLIVADGNGVELGVK